MRKVNDFSKAKVGDTVWSLRFGKGFIRSLTDSDHYAVDCKFKDCVRLFTIEGFYSIEEHAPDLYRTEPKVTAEEPREKQWFRVVKYLVWYMPHPNFSNEPVCSVTDSEEQACEVANNLSRFITIQRVIKDMELEV